MVFTEVELRSSYSAVKQPYHPGLELQLLELMCKLCAGGAEDDAESEAIDPYDLLEPVEILSKLPKNFYSQIVGFKLVLNQGLLILNRCHQRKGCLL